jgi:hypothetical protein
VGIRFRLALAATSAVTCATVVLGAGFGGPGPASAEEKIAAKRVTVRFFNALDRGRWSQACALLTRQFYRRHHVPDLRHCIVGFTVGMGGWAVKYRIGHVDGNRDTIVVHAVVDGAPGTVRLIREHHGYRVLAMQGDRA